MHIWEKRACIEYSVLHSRMSQLISFSHMNRMIFSLPYLILLHLSFHFWFKSDVKMWNFWRYSCSLFITSASLISHIVTKQGNVWTIRARTFWIHANLCCHRQRWCKCETVFVYENVWRHYPEKKKKMLYSMHVLHLLFLCQTNPLNILNSCKQSHCCGQPLWRLVGWLSRLDCSINAMVLGHSHSHWGSLYWKLSK